ncbi:MATE family efflux transporter [Anaerotignum sp.]|uniref:MATE family efflux transporter n=1 Tax=Anaerotignum sp. TaxID=2039241 RepID=UPI0033177FC7
MAQENILGTEKIGRLLFKFSVPTTLTLIVNSLYNIVDQVFIGRAVGIDGVAATNVAFPIFIMSAAMALMIGDGCASNICLSLGRGDNEAGDNYFANGIIILLLAGVIFFCGGLLFLKPMVLFFGASKGVIEISASYTAIILWGLPFSMCNMALTAIIRADGNPKYMMRTMMIGAAINLILDPIFIFEFHMGVQGAALATIIGQIVSGCLALAYIPKMEHIQLQKKYLKLQGKLIGGIFKLGFPSFCMQMATAATQIVMNNLMGRYGALSPYGSEVALSCYGIMTKLYQIAHAMFVGLAAGTQPIHGFNFGAKQYDRVRRTYCIGVWASLVISVFWFCVFRWGGVFIAGIFVENEPLFLEFAKYCFRVYMLAFFLYGPPQVTASFFQAVGKPGKSLLVALSRQIVFLIPFALILSKSFHLNGALFAAPLADTLAFLLAMILISFEFRSWKKSGFLVEGKENFKAIS